MTKENLIPIENKKPFETVAELKNEVPSFEEFMKTYESDENLNYDDLTFSDISDKGKGYGPCYKDCGYGVVNPNCECYINRSEGRYVSLYLACPVPKNQYPLYCNDKTAGQWYHKDCRGHMYINVDLNIKCMKPGCGRNSHMRNWKFACSNHPADYDWASRGEFYNSAADALNSVWKSTGSHLARRIIEIMIDKVLVAEGLHYE